MLSCGEATTVACTKLVTKVGQKTAFLFCGKFWAVDISFHPVLEQNVDTAELEAKENNLFQFLQICSFPSWQPGLASSPAGW